MTVKENRDRIVHLEDDMKDLDVRVARLETSLIDLLARIDIIIRMSRATIIIVAATLGIDLGIEGGMIWWRKLYSAQITTHIVTQKMSIKREKEKGDTHELNGYLEHITNQFSRL